jgi:hypothetical protein
MIEVYVSRRDAAALERARDIAERFNAEVHALNCGNEDFPFHLAEALGYAPSIALHYISRGVTVIPAVVYDGRCIFSGYLPSPDELRDALLRLMPWEQLLKNVDYEEISLEKAREIYLMSSASEKAQRSSRRRRKSGEEKAGKAREEKAPSGQEKEAGEKQEAPVERKGDSVDSLVEFVPDAVKG